MEILTYVDLETARAAGGVRMVVSGVIPSPWSEAAKAIFHVKQLPALLVRSARERPEISAWSGARNVPALLYNDELTRTGWAEILALAEQLGGACQLVPADQRVLLHGMAHELAGANGLGWNNRLLMIHGSISSGGARSFPLPVGQYLAPRYGYHPDLVPAARPRILEILTLFDRQLAASRAAGHRYLLGGVLTALDLYLTTFLTPLVGVSEEECPNMRADLRAAFRHLEGELGPLVPPALAEHRLFIYRQHLPWPIPL